MQTTLGGGDILERLKRGVNSILSGDLTQKDEEDVKRIIDALYAKYSNKMRDVVDRGRGAYSGVVADQYLNLHLPRYESSQFTQEEREAAKAILRARGKLK